MQAFPPSFYTCFLVLQVLLCAGAAGLKLAYGSAAASTAWMSGFSHPGPTLLHAPQLLYFLSKFFMISVQSFLRQIMSSFLFHKRPYFLCNCHSQNLLDFRLLCLIPVLKHGYNFYHTVTFILNLLLVDWDQHHWLGRFIFSVLDGFLTTNSFN